MKRCVFSSAANGSIFLSQILVLMTLGGCVAVPRPYMPAPNPDGTPAALDFRRVVGRSHSERPIIMGKSTRADVEHLLGAPIARTLDGRVYVYTQQMITEKATTKAPLQPTTQPQRQRTYYLRIEFDGDDVVNAYRVTNGDWQKAGGDIPIAERDPVPDELLTP